MLGLGHVWADALRMVPPMGLVSRAEGWVSVASALETEPTPPGSDMSSRVIGLGLRVLHERAVKAPSAGLPRPRQPVP